MKKILSLFLTLAIVIGLFVPAASAEPATPGATTTEFAFLVTSDLTCTARSIPQITPPAMKPAGQAPPA